MHSHAEGDLRLVLNLTLRKETILFFPTLLTDTGGERGV